MMWALDTETKMETQILAPEIKAPWAGTKQAKLIAMLSRKSGLLPRLYHTHIVLKPCYCGVFLEGEDMRWKTQSAW